VDVITLQRVVQLTPPPQPGGMVTVELDNGAS
jgi:alkyl hydroperoxide reductase subunit AhpF